MLIFALLLASQEAQAGCPATADSLRTDIQTAELAYAEWSWEEFDQAITNGRTDLGCLGEVLSSSDVQAVHRLFVLVGTRTQDVELAQSAFGGLLSLDPNYTPDLELAPKGSLLRTAFEKATLVDPSAGRPLPAGQWFVDGASGATEMPSHRASLVQQVASDGAVSSWYIEGSDLPESLSMRLSVVTDPVASEPPPLVLIEPAETPDSTALVEAALPISVPPKRDKGTHRSLGMLLGGIGLAAVGVGGMAYGELLEGQMEDVERRKTALSKYRLGLAGTFGGYALGATGGALVVGAVIKGKW